MGTRADFYVGRGPEARWVGSIAWDGYPDGVDSAVRCARTEAAFLGTLERFFASRSDVTRPADGWPWPWEDSGMTDYAYALDGGQVWASCFGSEWFKADKREPENAKENVAVFPDMKARQAVTFGPRSGVLLLAVKK